MDSKAGMYACLRCKSRKIKCDRGMPKCTSCERANSACLTVDPATGRQIPRGYISHLEDRVKELEAELAKAHRHCPRNAHTWAAPHEAPHFGAGCGGMSTPPIDPGMTGPPREQLKNSNLQSNTLSLPINLPSKAEAECMLKGYFERCNILVPVLHREQFVTDVFEPVYGPISPDLNICSDFTVVRLKRSATEPQTGTFYRRWIDCGGSLTAVPEPKMQVCLFFMYMVFALASVTSEVCDVPAAEYRVTAEDGPRYYSAAMCYYQTVSCDTGPVEEVIRSLQALVMRALYGFIVPSHPSAWYATGTAMRMCINLDLHNEERVKLDAGGSEFIVDMRRRLFWSTYYLDRLVSVYLARPVNIGDEYIQCELPSVADDSWLMPPRRPSDDDNAKAGDATAAASQRGSTPGLKAAVPKPGAPPDRPSYKWVFRYVLQLRRIQQVAKAQLYDRTNFDERANIREVRDKLVADLEAWHDSFPQTTEMFNFAFNLNYLEVNYFYTLMLLFRSSRGIPNPTVEETRRMLRAGTRVLTMYVQHRNSVGFIYSWAAVHNVLHASSSCLFGLYRTNALDNEYDLNSFEHTMEEIMHVVSNLKTRYNASPSTYGPLHTMMRVTLDFLRTRGDEPWRKRARVTQMPATTSKDVPAAVGPAANHQSANDAAVHGPVDAPGNQALHNPDTVRPYHIGGNFPYTGAFQASSAGDSGPVTPQLRSCSTAASNVATPMSQLGDPPLPSCVVPHLPPGPLAPGDRLRFPEQPLPQSTGHLGADDYFDVHGQAHSGVRDVRDKSSIADSQGFQSTSFNASRGMSSPSVGASDRTVQNDAVSESTPSGPPVAGIGARFDPRMPEPAPAIDPMQPIIVPRAVSESLAPIIPGYSEDAQYNEFQVYDLLDDISRFFDGFATSQPPMESAGRPTY